MFKLGVLKAESSNERMSIEFFLFFFIMTSSRMIKVRMANTVIVPTQMMARVTDRGRSSASDGCSTVGFVMGGTAVTVYTGSTDEIARKISLSLDRDELVRITVVEVCIDKERELEMAMCTTDVDVISFAE